jgi:hypothetical protein
MLMEFSGKSADFRLRKVLKVRIQFEPPFSLLWGGIKTVTVYSGDIGGEMPVSWRKRGRWRIETCPGPEIHRHSSLEPRRADLGLIRSRE